MLGINKKSTRLIIIALPVIIAVVAVAYAVLSKQFTTVECIVDFKGETIEFSSADGLTITADVYETENPNAPWIILYHQAGYSRGEYRPIAPRLNQFGYNCLAIDQRSGYSINQIDNQTYNQAVEKGKSTDFLDALQDLEAGLSFVEEKYNPEKIMIWGSSYSAALVFIMGQKYKQNVDAILAFSPGEYFIYENNMIRDIAKEIECPVFITSARSEFSEWKDIFNNIGHTKKTKYIPDSEGYHGSKALWENHYGNEECWMAVQEFLSKY